MQEFDRRIAVLEAEIAQLRRAAPGSRRAERGLLALSIAVIASLGVGLTRVQAVDATFDTIRAKRLVLVDEEGHRRGELRVDSEGSGRLELYGAQGETGETRGEPKRPFASISAHRGGGQLDLGSLAGETTATLGATGFGETWGGFLRLASDGYPVVSLWTQNGTANFQMIDSDEEGGFLCGTRSVSSGRAGWVELRNGKGKSAMYLLSGEKGDGQIELYDQRGVARTLRANDDAPKPPAKK